MRSQIIFLLFISPFVFGQQKSMVYTNDTHSYHLKSRSEFSNNPPIVNEITLNPDYTFEFYSRPEYSCASWKSYKGNWQIQNDTISFHDQYNVIEDNVRFFYNRDSQEKYILKFSTDKKSKLKNRNITIDLEYDFDTIGKDIRRELTLNQDNVIEIPFSSIPNHPNLSNLRIEYKINSSETRYGYITENKTINMKYGNVPNIIEIEFVETPIKEIVHRTTKFLLKENNLEFLSSFKTKTKLIDYYRTIEFEKNYQLEN